MPRSREQNEQMREATRTAVVHSALLLFAERGFVGTSTRQIARHAGISTGLMYHYFDSKESLLRAVFDYCMVILSDAFSAAYGQSNPEERLASLLGAMFDLLARETSFWSLFFMMRSQPAIMSVLVEDFRQWTEQLRSLFELELRQQNRANPELDSLMLYSLVEGTIQQYLLNPSTYPLEPMVEQIVMRFGGRSGEQWSTK